MPYSQFAPFNSEIFVLSGTLKIAFNQLLKYVSIYEKKIEKNPLFIILERSE